jgi:5-methylcytosine-specific restriction endonuclease McrA
MTKVLLPMLAISLSMPSTTLAKQLHSTVERSHGRIQRSASARNEFKRSSPCPATGRSKGACPGYVIDHVVPLKRGGADAPSNMQWQTREEAKAKDKWE